MTKQQYEALQELQKETEKKAREIANHEAVFVEVNVHRLEPEDEFWNQVSHEIKKDEHRIYYCMPIFSNPQVYSRNIEI